MLRCKYKKGDFKRFSIRYFKCTFWVLVILPAMAFSYGGHDRGIEIAIACMVCIPLFWVFIAMVYGLLYVVIPHEKDDDETEEIMRRSESIF